MSLLLSLVCGTICYSTQQVCWNPIGMFVVSGFLSRNLGLVWTLLFTSARDDESQIDNYNLCMRTGSRQCIKIPPGSPQWSDISICWVCYFAYVWVVSVGFASLTRRQYYVLLCDPDVWNHVSITGGEMSGCVGNGSSKIEKVGIHLGVTGGHIRVPCNPERFLSNFGPWRRILNAVHVTNVTDVTTVHGLTYAHFVSYIINNLFEI